MIQMGNMFWLNHISGFMTTNKPPSEPLVIGGLRKEVGRWPEQSMWFGKSNFAYMIRHRLEIGY
jgi:hypothetical protein